MGFAWICLPELFVEKTTNTRQKLVLLLVESRSEMQAQKQVVSGQSVKRNSISIVREQPKMLLPMLSLMFFTSNI